MLNPQLNHTENLRLEPKDGFLYLNVAGEVKNVSDFKWSGQIIPIQARPSQLNGSPVGKAFYCWHKESLGKETKWNETKAQHQK